MTRRLFTRAPRTRKVRGLTVGVIGLRRRRHRDRWRDAANVISGGFGNEQVGHEDAAGKLLADNQRITPYGQRSVITNGRLLASNLSPNGKQLAALSWQTFTGFVTVFDAPPARSCSRSAPGSEAMRSSETARSRPTAPTTRPTARACGCRRRRTC